MNPLLAVARRNTPAVTIRKQQRRRARMLDRIRAAQAARAAQGLPTSSEPPYGFRLGDDGRLVADLAEQRAIKRLRELAEAGHTIRQIAAQLQAEGHKPRGVRWHTTTIHRLLERGKSDER